MFKIKGLIFMLSILFLVLYCEKKHGAGKELEDFSQQSLISPPSWVKNGILYQVFPRAYTSQGTFNALKEKLDYIQDLNVDIIWLMPIFPIGEKGKKGSVGCPYSVRDFKDIHPELGSKEDFKKLVEAIHQHGMKVILGWVPNHSSNDNYLMQDHPDWFMKDSLGKFTREVADWSDITDFDYDNPEMREYMIESMLYWVRKFDIDGYRCDVAGMVPNDFWKEANNRLRNLKSNILLLAEWEDPEILMTGFTSDYDWTLYHILKDIRMGKKRTSEAISFIDEKDSRYPQNALPMRFLENHDEARSLYEFGSQAIEAYATFVFTLPGLPLIYAGQEFGDDGPPDHLKFEPYVLKWEETDESLLEMYKFLIQMRKKYSCFTNGRYIPLQVACLRGSVGAFLRDDEMSAALIICNLQSKPAEKIVVTMADNLRNKLLNFEFKNLKNPERKIDFNEIVVKELPGFTTDVFIALK